MAKKIDLTSGFNWTSDEPDGASAVGFSFDTPAYSTAGAKLLSLSNNGTEKVYVDKDGYLSAVRFAAASDPATRYFDGEKLTTNLQLTLQSTNSDVLIKGGGATNYGLILDTSADLFGPFIGGTGDKIFYFRPYPQDAFANRGITNLIVGGGDANANPGAGASIYGGSLTLIGGHGSSGSSGDAHGGDVVLAGGTGYGTGVDGKIVFTQGQLESSVADGATAVAFDFDTDTTYSTDGANLMRLSNNGTAVLDFSYGGGISYGSGATTAAHNQSLNLNWLATGTQTSSGVMSTVIGRNCTASGDRSLAGGFTTTTTHNDTIAWGRDHLAVGAYNAYFGYNHTGDTGTNYSLVCGRNADASGYRSALVIGGYLSTASTTRGATQGGNIVSSGSTTDATPDVLVNAVTSVDLQADSTVAFTGIVVARSDESDGNVSAGWKVEGVIYLDEAGNCTLSGSAVTEIYSGFTTASVALSGDDTSDGLSITVTGEASTNIRWCSNLMFAQASYV